MIRSDGSICTTKTWLKLSSSLRQCREEVPLRRQGMKNVIEVAGSYT